MSGCHLVDCPQAVECSWISDKRQKLRDDVDKALSTVANMEVRGDMALDLRVTSPERHEHTESEQFTCGHVDAGPG